MLVVCQEGLGKRRRTLLGPRVGDVELVEGFADRRGGPDVDGCAGHQLNLVQQVFFPLHNFLLRALCSVDIDADAAARHFNQMGEQRRFESPNVLDALLLDQGFEMAPQF